MIVHSAKPPSRKSLSSADRKEIAKLVKRNPEELAEFFAELDQITTAHSPLMEIVVPTIGCKLPIDPYELLRDAINAAANACAANNDATADTAAATPTQRP